jgi:hypothetical protein
MARDAGKAFGWINAVVGVLFVACALLQYNDPDPLRWIAIYGLAAAACATHGRIGLDWLLAAAAALAALVWAALLLPSVSGFRPSDLFRTMKAETPAIELSREVLGLLIVAGWMIVLIAVSRRKRPA